jgi:hypothetical protein
MYDLDGNLLKEFASIKEAEKETGIKQQNIYRVCSSKKGTAGGFQFRFEKDFKEKIEKFQSNSIRHKKRKINIYDSDGNFLKQVESIQEASKETNVLPQNISMCCKHKVNSVKGFQFRYADETNDKKIEPIKKRNKKFIIKKDNKIILTTKKIKDVEAITGISYYKLKKELNNSNKLKQGNIEVELLDS